MCLNVIAMNKLGPISSFLDQGTCRNTLLPQLNDGLEDTQATVQDDHIPLVEYGGEHPKQQSNCGTHVVEFLLILVAKWPWFMGNEHEPRACEFVCPDAHAFI